jgi:uncharacterized protein (DUF2062 family)
VSFNKVRNYWVKYVRKTYKAVRKYRREKKAGLRKWLANGIGNKLLWKFTDRGRVSLGFSLGFAVAMLPPLPIQTVLAIILSIKFRANIPASALAVWISNPATALPLFIFQCKIGKWLLSKLGVEYQSNFEFDLHSVSCATLGILLTALIGAFLCYLLIFNLWGFAKYFDKSKNP